MQCVPTFRILPPPFKGEMGRVSLALSPQPLALSPLTLDLPPSPPYPANEQKKVTRNGTVKSTTKP